MYSDPTVLDVKICKQKIGFYFLFTNVYDYVHCILKCLTIFCKN